MKKSLRILGILLLCLLVVGAFSMTAFAEETGEPVEEYSSIFYETAISLLPPVVAIVLALITKEVYSSLFIGILTGGVLYGISAGGFSIETTWNAVVNDGLIANLSDSYNVGILIFLVVLGIIVVMMNRASSITR